MLFPTRRPLPSVGKQGAPADSILCGVGDHNQGMRLRAMQAQVRGNEGPIQGPFIIVDAGENRHTDTLGELLNKVTDAREVLTLLRRKHPACVSVVNANALVPEPAVVPKPEPS